MIRLPSGVLAPPGAIIDEAHPLAEVLQYVWTGDAPGGGRDRIRGALAGVYSGATRHGTPLGLAIVANGTLTSSFTSNAQLSAFPYVQIGYGWFNSAGGAWALNWHQAAAGGSISQIALASSTTIGLGLRYAFAQPQRTITVTLPTTVGVPICAIAQVFSATDYRLYVNGLMTTGTTTTGSMTALDRFYSLGEQLNGGLWLSGHGQGATISDAEALAITANPRVELAKLFQRRVWVPVGAAGGAQTVAIGRAVESGAAQAFTATVGTIAAIGQASETDAAQALTVGLLNAIGQASETDTAQALASAQAVAIGQAVESDTAQALASTQVAAIGQALETDAAQALTYSAPGVFGQVTETDEALPLQANLVQAIGQAQETDAAQSLAVLTGTTIGMALEIDTAGAFTAQQALAIGQAAEADTAQPMTVGSPGSGTGATAAEIWGYVLSNGKTAEENLVENNAMLTAMSALLADCPANLLMVLRLLRNKQITNPTTGVFTIFADDDVTPLLQGNLFEDAAGAQPYRGQGAERREKLS